MEIDSTELLLKTAGDCPCKKFCGVNEKGQKLLTTHVWQEYLVVEQLRKTERGRMICAMRKETIERAFADAKENTPCVIHITEAWNELPDGSGLNAMNLKKLAVWSWRSSRQPSFISVFCLLNTRPLVFA